jgi:hypothetical protein
MAELYSACAHHAATANRFEMAVVGSTRYDENHGSIWCDLGDHWYPARTSLTLRKKRRVAR